MTDKVEVLTYHQVEKTSVGQNTTNKRRNTPFRWILAIVVLHKAYGSEQSQAAQCPNPMNKLKALGLLEFFLGMKT